MGGNTMGAVKASTHAHAKPRAPSRDPAPAKVRAVSAKSESMSLNQALVEVDSDGSDDLDEERLEEMLAKVRLKCP